MKNKLGTSFPDKERNKVRIYCFCWGCFDCVFSSDVVIVSDKRKEIGGVTKVDISFKYIGQSCELQVHAAPRVGAQTEGGQILTLKAKDSLRVILYSCITRACQRSHLRRIRFHRIEESPVS